MQLCGAFIINGGAATCLKCGGIYSDIVITFAKEVMFLPEFVCPSVCVLAR